MKHQRQHNGNTYELDIRSVPVKPGSIFAEVYIHSVDNETDRTHWPDFGAITPCELVDIYEAPTNDQPNDWRDY